MQADVPSRTALAAAAHRAAHQLLEQGRIWSDPLALAILGPEAESIARGSAERPLAARTRFFIAARSRFAEEALAAAVAGGLGQLVIVGAGLDTYAYRGAHREQLRVFEVDHPATQAWKRQCLAQAGIPVPELLRYVAVDFQRESLAGRLSEAGLDSAAPVFFSWLGVVPYLPESAVFSTLEYIAALPGGAQVAFDYGEPSHTLAPDAREAHAERARRVAALGEPWISCFEPQPLHTRLTALGFGHIEDLGPDAIVGHYLARARADGARRGGHLLRAVSSTDGAHARTIDRR